MKKYIGFISILLTLTLLFSGCTNNKKETDTTDESKKTEDTTESTFVEEESYATILSLSSCDNLEYSLNIFLK